MQVMTVDPRSDRLWMQLVENVQSDVFHSPAWINAVTMTYDWQPEAYVLVDDAGKPVAGLPFCVINDIRGKRVICFPFSDACDPLTSTIEQWDILLNKLREFNAPVIVRCLHNDIPLETYPGENNKQAAWHGMDIRRSAEEIWDDFPGSVRRAVRKSEKSGVIVEADGSEAAMRAYFDLHLSIRKYKYRLLAQPYALFRNIWSELIQQGQGTVLTAKIDGEVIAANVYLKWKDTLTYKFSASNTDYQNARPTDALIWGAIQYAKNEGLSYIDFGLSDLDQDGLIEYKRKYATVEKRISFLRYEPQTLDVTIAQKQAGAIFPKLTELFTEPTVPDEITEEAGDLLYRFFA